MTETQQRPLRFITVVAIILLATANGSLSAGGAGEGRTAATEPPVSLGLPGVGVVELFTSGGCSSCPPAEAALSSLLENARAAGEPIYALAWHVDYWNNLGWKDPFSLAAATERQRRYAAALSTTLYTPEIVVDGATGASAAGLRRLGAIATKALAHPASAALQIAVRAGGPRALSVRVVATGATSGATVGVALTEDGLVQHPDAGENAGRTLRDDAVVRSFATLPSAGGRALLSVPPNERLSRSHVVAFVQSTSTLAILGASEVDLATLRMARETTARVSGRLVDRAGSGVGGAQVQACSASLCIPSWTDSSGRFALTAIPAGRYDVKIFLSKRGEKPAATLPVDARDGEDISLPTLAVGT